MPVRPTYPGVYVEELASGVRPVAAVATSTAVFIGTFRKGLIDEAVRILSTADFEREYGGLERASEASYAVQQFFLNGGTEAWVVRIGQPGPLAAPITALTSAASGTLNSFGGAAILDFSAGRRIRGTSAQNPGDWGNFLRIEVEHNTSAADAIFGLIVSEVAISGNRTSVLQTETFRNLSMKPDTANYAVEVVNQGSRLIQLTRASALNDFTPPAANGTVSANLPAIVPAIGGIDDIGVTLSVAQPSQTPIALAIPAAAAGSFADWTSGFEAAIRAVAADPTIPAEQQACFAGATVAITGTGAVGDPRRFSIVPGAASAPASFVFGGADAGNYGLAPPLGIAAGGITGNDLPDPVPAIGDIDTIDIRLVLPLWLTLPAASANGFVEWAAGLQSALRAAGAGPSVPAQQRAYFTGATVDLIGDGSAANPRRFVIRAGRGAQPFDPAAVFSFIGDDIANYGLAAPQAAGAQQYLPTAGSGANGTIIDPATGNYLVPAEAFRGDSLLKTGLYAIDDMDIVNIISIPDAPRLGAAGALSVYAEAITYAESRRSMIIIDIPETVVSIDQMQTWLAGNGSLRHPNSAVYYPRTLTPDPLNQNRQRSLAASGTIGGLWARTDTARGVWKAPAGTDARLRNVESLTYVMTDLENGTLNPLGVNCLRNFPVYSNICWGARTLDGADALASDWKYVPVRRTTLFIEESLYRGTKWVVFEPNDEPLWSQIRLNVGAFMHDLFRKAAFQGTTPREAYFVKCDGDTTTQSDIDLGIVNIEVGFAPLKPAEFVIIKIQQIARVTAD